MTIQIAHEGSLRGLISNALYGPNTCDKGGF
jgi:hypothetical protein